MQFEQNLASIACTFKVTHWLIKHLLHFLLLLLISCQGERLGFVYNEMYTDRYIPEHKSFNIFPQDYVYVDLLLVLILVSNV